MCDFNLNTWILDILNIIQEKRIEVPILKIFVQILHKY